MKYFLDTEFIESGYGKPVTLISIGIVCDDGREMYAVSSAFNSVEANEWVRENVFPHLGNQKEWKCLRDIATEIVELVGGDETPEFWGYYADYDWVVFCSIFGRMIDLPKSFPMYCNDIKQWAHQLGNPRLPEQSSTEHNALNDARWNKAAYEYLRWFQESC